MNRIDFLEESFVVLIDMYVIVEKFQLYDSIEYWKYICN